MSGEEIMLPAQRPQAQVGLFGTTDPMEVVARASEVANALGKVLEDRHLVVPIGRGHVTVEGWTLLGSMVGVFATVDWCRRISEPAPPGALAGAQGWEARVTARTADGREIGSAEAQCTRGEKQWTGREDHALRSMAQTRAVSKALRLPLGFIVQLAGYEATPAEEMPDYGAGPEASPPRRRPGRPRKAAKARSGPGEEEENDGRRLDLRDTINRAAKARGMDTDQLLGIAREAGVDPDVGPATVPQLEIVLAAVEALPLPPETPLAEVPDHEFPY